MMKKSLVPFFILLLTGLLIGQDDQSQPEETMENADMADGTNHWHGDAQAIGADSETDFVTNTSSTPKGIQVVLHAMGWTTVTQEIHQYKGRTASMQMTIVYQASPDLKFSTLGTNYGNLGPLIGFGGMNLPARMGQVTALIDMPPDSRSSLSSSGTQNVVTIYSDKVVSGSFAPKTDGKTQTFTALWNPPPATESDNPTFVLAIPPGNGTLTLLKISLTPGQGMNNPGSPNQP